MIARKLEARKSAFAARKNECGFVDALKSEEGAIDLASIMVGVIVIGVIAGVIAATVFAVIPWSQDKAAQQSLDAVNQAESVSYAQSTDAGVGSYQGNSVNTITPKSNITLWDGAGAAPGLLQAAKGVEIKSNGTVYVAVSKSATGNYYLTTSKNPAVAVKIAKNTTDALTFADINTEAAKTLVVTDAAATTTVGNLNDDSFKLTDFDQ